MKRAFDFFASLILLSLLFSPMLMIALLIWFNSRGPIIHWSNRVGYKNCIFKMPKFRTMKMNTPQLATNLLTEPNKYLTRLGSFLRKTSLDELPQLWSILIGDMSFVGPRPALFNQYDLVALRSLHGIHELLPGLTGWAQVNGRDELEIKEKVLFEIEYMQRKTFWFDLKILILTVSNVFFRIGIKH